MIQCQKKITDTRMGLWAATHKDFFSRKAIKKTCPKMYKIIVSFAVLFCSIGSNYLIFAGII